MVVWGTERIPGNTLTVTRDYTFRCPECGQEIAVNASMREAILSSGCPVCTESVEQTAFELQEEA